MISSQLSIKKNQGGLSVSLFLGFSPIGPKCAVQSPRRATTTWVSCGDRKRWGRLELPPSSAPSAVPFLYLKRLHKHKGIGSRHCRGGGGAARSLCPRVWL